MSRKGRSLDGIEDEGKEQDKRAEELRSEVEQHQERIVKLEQTLKELAAIRSELRSDGVELAIVAAERAKNDSSSGIERARLEREQLLSENQEMADRVKQSHRKTWESQQKLNMLAWKASGSVKGELQAAQDALEHDLNQLGFADATLKQAKAKLQAIDI